MDKELVEASHRKINSFSSFWEKYLASYSGIPLACWQRIFLTFINDVSGGVSYFLSLYFVTVLHINIATAGIIISSYGLGTAFGGVIGGKLSDKFSPSIISILSLLVKAIIFLALIKLKTVNLLIINLFILGFTTYSFITSNNVWVLHRSKAQEAEKLKAINILYTAANLGNGLSAVIVSLFAHYGFSTLFLFSSVLLFISSIYLIWQERKYSSKATIQQIVERTVESKEAHHQARNVKVVVLILGCLFLVGLILSQLSSSYSVYVLNAFPKLGINSVSILFVLNSLIIIFFQTPLINFLRNFNKVLMAGLGAFLVGFGMFILSFSYIFSLAVISCIVYTIGEMLFVSMGQLICYQSGAEKKKGYSLGLYQTTYATSVVVGPTLGGMIYHHLGGNYVWYFSGLLGVVCLIACLIYRKHG